MRLQAEQWARLTSSRKVGYASVVVVIIIIIIIIIIITTLLLKSYLQLIHLEKKTSLSKHYLQFLSFKKTLSFDKKKNHLIKKNY